MTDTTNRGGVVCQRCDGYGYKRFTDEHPVVEVVNGRFVTTHQGSGCSMCLGLGILLTKTGGTMVQENCNA